MFPLCNQASLPAWLFFLLCALHCPEMPKEICGTSSGSVHCLICIYAPCLRLQLHLAAKHGHVEAAQALLGAGASHAATDAVGERPLHYAVRGGHLELIEALLVSVLVKLLGAMCG